MTDLAELNGAGADLGPLPTVMTVSGAFSRRAPSERVSDLLVKYEPGYSDLGELIKAHPFRVIAFRALLKEFPLRDPGSLWMHAYDVELEIEEADPTAGGSPTIGPLSASTGA
jgi:hypothetical protein